MSEHSVDSFIARWGDQTGGQERANYVLFLTELCDVIGVARPDPAGSERELNAYVFERLVHEPDGEGGHRRRRIDLYKHGCFVLEAKQSRLDPAAAAETEEFNADAAPRGRRGAGKSWDTLMFDAKAQAVNYARCLPAGDGWPPFVLVCDVGHVIEVFADFTGQGKNYAQFPDRQGFRIYLHDLRDPAIRARLKAIWDDPQSLDPARRSAQVTRAIARRLAAVSKALESSRTHADDVAMFLMRCLFTMFAEDVELLPKKSFRDLLSKCEDEPDKFQPLVAQLWEAMDQGSYAFALEAQVKRFNGEFFKYRHVCKLGRKEIGALLAAAEADWREVEPAIFGTLLEQALDPAERRRLGAHYTPRAYVERLVVATVLEPLRAEWHQALATAERQKEEGRNDEAAAGIAAFHARLCQVRVLDPACGTGNFLYVALELMKRLEGEVLEALASLGGQESFAALEGHTVDPRQFLGIEVNPRAAAIAELVLWIGYLQWHFRTRGAPPSEPILRAFHNIRKGDAVLDWDGAPVPAVVAGAMRYPNPRRPVWPSAEFIIGNPPFIGGKDLRERLGDGYAEALWQANGRKTDSADFVMYWWKHAAELLTAKGSVLRRFGFVTTNSISQLFQRRVMEPFLSAKDPISLVMAVPDHPWTKADRDSAAVRIAMTVAEAGSQDGLLRQVTREAALDTDAPEVELADRRGRINSDLTVGVDLSQCLELQANREISSRGMPLHGAGFIVTKTEAERLGLGRREGLEKHIRPYRNGRDLMARSRDVLVIDLFGLSAEEVQYRYPEVYQHLKIEVKEKIILKNGIQHKIGRDWNNREYRRTNWWLFGENIPDFRKALIGLERYIGTVETAKHRVFQFLDAAILPDNKIVVIASDDQFLLGVLSSKIHYVWYVANSAKIGMYEGDAVYVKSRCFDPFPFPVTDDLKQQRIRQIAEEIDGHRKRVLADHPHLTLTGLYNVLERLKSGVAAAALDPAERRILDDGLVLILLEQHERLDHAVAAAYGWPVDLADGAILARLVALNQERRREEARGQVRWLRPAYQITRFGSAAERREQLEATLVLPDAAARKPAFPADDLGQTAAVMAALAEAPSGLDAAALAARFRQGRRVEDKITAVLTALFRMGFIAREDKTWWLRRVA